MIVSNRTGLTAMIPNQHDKLIDGTDCDKPFVNDETPSSIVELNFLHKRHRIFQINKQDLGSPGTRTLSPTTKKRK
ncbi:unnamed protein product [Rotaria socialis]|uniref:Uncharacterized protein n=1 Tax=Rotaria socialis TaxID=392032 RepID=A0A820KMK9_9BILA|nr:unnamed protein product [Rotaria socialis]CAF3436575.1 unnamed protein product [Rotaria socialis]CAF4202755.1 unnamed protein product [Rotaria socialis]CAF4342463.1 unnamed protein product [Rotaria socialis]CAF4408358.1 unnamed protein product [Rotaria socialis]